MAPNRKDKVELANLRSEVEQVSREFHFIDKISTWLPPAITLSGDLSYQWTLDSGHYHPTHHLGLNLY